MTRRFIPTLAMLVLTLGLIASAAPVGAEDLIPNGTTWPPVATGPCLLTGQTLTFDSSGTYNTYLELDPGGTERVKLTGNGFTVVNQNGLGMGIGSALCSETLSIYGRDSNGFGGYAWRITSATFHGGAHLAPGTQMNVSFRFGNEAPFTVTSTYPSGYNGDYDLTIPNTVSPQGDDWSTCDGVIATPGFPGILTVKNGWSFSKWDGGKSTLTGDHNGKYWVDYTLEWAKC
jgi:hypothetical protein